MKVFMSKKGLISVDTECPKSFNVLFGLSHKGAYTSRCQMPEFEQIEVGFY